MPLLSASLSGTSTPNLNGGGHRFQFLVDPTKCLVVRDIHAIVRILISRYEIRFFRKARVCSSRLIQT